MVRRRSGVLAPPPAPPASTIPTSLATTRAALLQAAQGNDKYKAQNGLLNGWEWDWFYTHTRGGTSGASWDKLGLDISRNITLDEYMSVLQQSGLSGLRGASGLAAFLPSRVPAR